MQLIFFAIVGFILEYLRTGRFWLAVAVISLRTVTLGLNFLLDPNQETEFFTQFDECADYFYQAVTTAKGMVCKNPA